MQHGLQLYSCKKRASVLQWRQCVIFFCVDVGKSWFAFFKLSYARWAYTRAWKRTLQEIELAQVMTIGNLEDSF